MEKDFSNFGRITTKTNNRSRPANFKPKRKSNPNREGVTKKFKTSVRMNKKLHALAKPREISSHNGQA
jgi:hypothetical protein